MQNPSRWTFVVLTQTDAKKRRYVDLEMLPEEFAAVGHVTAQWAYLEHLMRGHIVGLVKHFGGKADKAAESDSFRKRHRYWRELVEATAALNAEYGARALDVVERVGDIMGERHLFVHGRVVWKPQKDLPLEFKGAKGRARRVNAERIERTAHKLAIINYDLMMLGGEPVVVHDALPRIPLPPVR